MEMRYLRRQRLLTSMMAIIGVCFDSREVDSDGDEIPEEAEIANEYDGYNGCLF